MSKQTGPKLRPPKPFFERVKLLLVIGVYIAFSEWSTPFPFYASTAARLAVVSIILLIFREFHHARQEVDLDWVKKTEKVHSGIRGYTSRISSQTWLKVQRVATWAICFYAFGMLVNTMTNRCHSAVQCAVLAPRMAIENLPMIIQYMVLVSLTLFQLGIMFYAMVKVGSYKVVMPGTVDVSFDDVWGQDEAKHKVLEQVKLLEDSAEVEAAGGYMPKGLLLYGPPGTGKTYLAKAAANYSSKPLILVPPGAFQATFVGINLLKVWTLFREVRKLARRYGGVIVFIDEIDSLGSRGGTVENGAEKVERACGCVSYRRIMPAEPKKIVVGENQMGTLEAFLSAMDGMEEPRGFLNRLVVFLGFKPLKPYKYKYLMIGATNMMDRLDPALLRAGRFGRKIHVTFPLAEGRQRTYEGYLRKIKHELSPSNIEWAARNHERGTGAEIKDIVNEAVLISFRDERENPGFVTFDDLMRAMVWVKFGESEKPFPREAAKRAIAIHEAGHAVALHALQRDRLHIWFATIERLGDAGGMVVPTELDEDWLKTKEELMAEIEVSLASRVAEEMFMNTTTNGHGGDGQQMTEVARSMVRYGHGGDTLGLYGDDDTKTKRQIEKILSQGLENCRALLEPRREEIQAVADLLEKRGTVPGDEIHEMLDEMEAAA